MALSAVGMIDIYLDGLARWAIIHEKAARSADVDFPAPLERAQRNGILTAYAEGLANLLGDDSMMSQVDYAASARLAHAVLRLGLCGDCLERHAAGQDSCANGDLPTVVIPAD